ncbi:MAG: helix-turn-helix transcriptional regulator [Moraxellaceae bacterium]|nr:helix-turn-helix transcriptional regulator [Pseudobdellovibrionaceae bacterium]
MAYEIEFGLTLQALRLKQNLSQSELSKLSHLDRTFISLLERGIRQPSLTTVFQLAFALKIKPSELIIKVENRVRRSRWSRLKT